MEKVLKHLKQDNKGMILFDLIVYVPSTIFHL